MRYPGTETNKCKTARLLVVLLLLLPMLHSTLHPCHASGASTVQPPEGLSDAEAAAFNLAVRTLSDSELESLCADMRPRVLEPTQVLGFSDARFNSPGSSPTGPRDDARGMMVPLPRMQCVRLLEGPFVYAKYSDRAYSAKSFLASLHGQQDFAMRDAEPANMLEGWTAGVVVGAAEIDIQRDILDAVDITDEARAAWEQYVAQCEMAKQAAEASASSESIPQCQRVTLVQVDAEGPTTRTPPRLRDVLLSLFFGLPGTCVKVHERTLNPDSIKQLIADFTDFHLNQRKVEYKKAPLHVVLNWVANKAFVSNGRFLLDGQERSPIEAVEHLLTEEHRKQLLVGFTTLAASAVMLIDEDLVSYIHRLHEWPESRAPKQLNQCQRARADFLSNLQPPSLDVRLASGEALYGELLKQYLLGVDSQRAAIDPLEELLRRRCLDAAQSCIRDAAAGAASGDDAKFGEPASTEQCAGNAGPDFHSCGAQSVKSAGSVARACLLNHQRQHTAFYELHLHPRRCYDADAAVEQFASIQHAAEAERAARAAAAAAAAARAAVKDSPMPTDGLTHEAWFGRHLAFSPVTDGKVYFDILAVPRLVAPPPSSAVNAASCKVDVDGQLPIVPGAELPFRLRIPIVLFTPAVRTAVWQEAGSAFNLKQNLTIARYHPCPYTSVEVRGPNHLSRHFPKEPIPLSLEGGSSSFNIDLAFESEDERSAFERNLLPDLEVALVFDASNMITADVSKVSAQLTSEFKSKVANDVQRLPAPIAGAIDADHSLTAKQRRALQDRYSNYMQVTIQHHPDISPADVEQLTQSSQGLVQSVLAQSLRGELVMAGDLEDIVKQEEYKLIKPDRLQNMLQESAARARNRSAHDDANSKYSNKHDQGSISGGFALPDLFDASFSGNLYSDSTWDEKRRAALASDIEKQTGVVVRVQGEFANPTFLVTGIWFYSLRTADLLSSFEHVVKIEKLRARTMRATKRIVMRDFLRTDCPVELAKTCPGYPNTTGSPWFGTCVDRNECMEPKESAFAHQCAAERACRNLVPFYECAPCPPSQAEDGPYKCHPDPCAVNNGGCFQLTQNGKTHKQTCSSTKGQVTCGACPANFKARTVSPDAVDRSQCERVSVSEELCQGKCTGLFKPPRLSVSVAQSSDEAANCLDGNIASDSRSCYFMRNEKSDILLSVSLPPTPTSEPATDYMISSVDLILASKNSNLSPDHLETKNKQHLARVRVFATPRQFEFDMSSPPDSFAAACAAPKLHGDTVKRHCIFPTPVSAGVVHAFKPKKSTDLLSFLEFTEIFVYGHPNYAQSV